jgi:hypothetical protein
MVIRQNRVEFAMTKFYSLIAACAVFVPFAISTMTQAAQIIA